MDAQDKCAHTRYYQALQNVLTQLGQKAGRLCPEISIGRHSPTHAVFFFTFSLTKRL